MTSGCVIPTVSLHSFRNVTVRLTEADSGKPVASLPFRVDYELLPRRFAHRLRLELRTPREVQAKTDQNGEAVIKLADYAWTTLLQVNNKERGYDSLFILNKQAIRKGEVVEDHYRSDKYPRLRLELHPLKRPNMSLHWTGSSRFSLVSMGPRPAAAPGQSALRSAASDTSAQYTGLFSPVSIVWYEADDVLDLAMRWFAQCGALLCAVVAATALVSCTRHAKRVGASVHRKDSGTIKEEAASPFASEYRAAANTFGQR